MRRIAVLFSALALLGLMALPASAQGYPSGMVAYWQFEEGSGSVIHSSVGSYDGQVSGATWSPGKVGGSLAFDGTDDYVAFGTNAFLNTSSSFSYSVWLRFDDLGQGTCQGEDFAAYEQMAISVHEGPYLYLATTGRLVSMVDTTSGWRLVATDTCSWSVGDWYHVAVTLDGAALTMYVNGAPVSTAAGGAKVTSGDGAGVKLGKMHYLNDYYFGGALDELAVFNRALSADEVQEHYQNGLVGQGYEYDFSGNLIANVSTGEDGLSQYVAGWSDDPNGWTEPLTLTVNGNPVSVDIAVGDGRFFTFVDPGTFAPSDLVRMTDSSGVFKELHVANLAVTSINGETGHVTGTCDVGMDVWLEHSSYDGQPDPRQFSADCNGGAFEGDFYPNELPNRPEGSFVEARQTDDDRDMTQVDAWYPQYADIFEGFFNVNLSDGEQYISGAGWGGPVTVTVDGVEVLTDYQYMYSDDCSPGGTPRPLCFDTWGRFPLEGFAFEPGQHVVVSDGVNLKDLVLADVSITTIDVPTGRVTGTCSVGLDVRLTDIGETFDFACDDGTFERFFEPYLGWSSTVKAIQSDDDGDWTKVEESFFYDRDGLFDGFLSPVNNDEVNTAKAGRPIPVKWLLLDGDGVPVSDPASFVSITSSGAACEGGVPTDAIEEYVGGSGLQYLGDGYWQFNWKTPKSYSGQCRTMTLTLLDGSNLIASFMFK